MREPVESSAVVSIGYDEESQYLDVEFTGGRVYRYLRVPVSEYETLRNAESIGIHVNKQIKPNYDYVEIDG